MLRNVPNGIVHTHASMDTAMPFSRIKDRSEPDKSYTYRRKFHRANSSLVRIQKRNYFPFFFFFFLTPAKLINESAEIKTSFGNVCVTAFECSSGSLVRSLDKHHSRWQGKLSFHTGINKTATRGLFKFHMFLPDFGERSNEKFHFSCLLPFPFPSP